MQKKRLGIIGAGGIAVHMAKTIAGMDNVESYAIASRDYKRAEAFKNTHGFSKAYGAYEELYNDPNVDFIYIATPHSHHAEQAKACIHAGKPVLCEKAFTKTAAEAREVLALAREKNVLIAEAMWPRYMPMADTLRAFVSSGKIGNITSLNANLGYNVYHKPRLSDPSLAGGALLDVGVYTLNFASLLFGSDIKEICASCIKSDTGVDMQNSMALTYKNGRTATLYSSVIACTDRMGMLYGDKGYAIVDNINNFEALRVYDKDHNMIEKIERPAQITGYEYEVQAMIDAMDKGEIECAQMPHSVTVEIMDWMDHIRHSFGVYYPAER